MKQVCKTRKIRETFVNLVNMHGTMLDPLLALQQRLEQFSKHEFATSFAFCYYFGVVVKIYEVCLDCLWVYLSLVCVKLPTLG